MPTILDLSAILPTFSRPQPRAVASQVFTLLLVCGAASGCSNEATFATETESLAETATEARAITTDQGDKTDSLNTAELQRVIVTLKPLQRDNLAETTASVDGPNSPSAPGTKEAASPMDAVVSELTAKYPGAKVLRTMPGFSQLVIELPGEQLGAFEREPMVLSAKPDKAYRPLQTSPQEKR